MEPAITVALLWSVFGATHVGLTTAAIRGRLVARLGELGFSLLYSAIAMACFSVLVLYYTSHRFEGPAALGLGAFPAFRVPLIALVVLGVVLMTASFAGYERSPYSVLGRGSFPPPCGLERVTRHGFFSGLVLFSAAHALLANRLVGAVFMAGSGAVALLGSLHQDRKLLARLGRPFAGYLEATSSVPFAAVLAGRQRIVWRELPLKASAAGAGIAIALRAAHDGIFAFGGGVFLAVLFASITVILVRTLRGSKSPRRSASVEKPVSRKPAFQP